MVESDSRPELRLAIGGVAETEEGISFDDFVWGRRKSLCVGGHVGRRSGRFRSGKLCMVFLCCLGIFFFWRSEVEIVVSERHEVGRRRIGTWC